VSLNHVEPPAPASAAELKPAEPPAPMEYGTDAPGVSERLMIFEYPPPPPPSYAYPEPPLPPPPPPIASIVLCALSQSLGTVQLVPEVRKTFLTVADGVGVAVATVHEVFAYEPLSVPLVQTLVSETQFCPAETDVAW
jgi:hypothetical protein